MKPGPNTVVTPRKISDLIEQVLNGKEVSITPTKSERSMIDRVARETGKIRVTTKIFVVRTDLRDVKEKKLYKKKAFFMLSFDFAMIGFAYALAIQLMI